MADIIIRKHFGVMTSQDSVIIPDGFYANAKNVSFKNNGSIRPFKQYSFFANQLTDSGKILNTYVHRKRDGTEIPLRVRDDGTNSHLEVYNDVLDKWETLLPNLTAGRKMAFASYNITIQDRLYMCNGIENFSKWTCGYGTIASNTSTTITLNARGDADTAEKQGFSSSGGTVIVDGVEYTYTGTSGLQLTGLSGLPVFTANTGCYEAVDDSSFSSLPKFKIMIVHMGRIIGVREGQEENIAGSKVSDPENYSVPATPAPDDPFLADFPEGSGPIKAIRPFGRNGILIFKEDMVILYEIDFPTSTTIISKRTVLREGIGEGTTNQDATVKIGNEIWYVNEFGEIKSIGISNNADGYSFDNIADWVKPTLSNGVFDEANAVWWEKENTFLLAYKKNSDSTFNDYVLVIELNRDVETGQMRKYISFLDWFVSSWYKYNGQLCFGHSSEPNCKKAFNGYARQHVDGSGKLVTTPHTALATTKRFSFGNEYLQKQTIVLGVIGMIGPGTTLKFQLDYDALGSRASLESTLDYTNDSNKIISPQLNMIGAFEIGSEPIGGTTDDLQDLSYFQVFFTLPPEHKPYDIQLNVYTDQEGARWIINNYIFKVADAGYQIPDKLKKTFK